MENKKWHKYQVTRTIQLSRIIKAPDRQTAIEWMYDSDADTKLIKETAVKINEAKRAKCLIS